MTDQFQWGTSHQTQPLTHDAQAIALLSECVTLLRDIRQVLQQASEP